MNGPRVATDSRSAEGPTPGRTGGRFARLALVLGGGAARGLAHIGVLDVLEREGIRPALIVGSSMGGLIGALSATGLSASDVTLAAREFSFPWWFAIGRLIDWDRIFPSAARILVGRCFEDLVTPLAVTAVDFEAGRQEVLQAGPLLPAIRATCAVPGVLPAVNIRGRWLVDGGLLNILPVDVAWGGDVDVVLAVNPGGVRSRRVPELDSRAASWLSRFGRLVPNPGVAMVSFEMLVRASEILLAQQATLATAMSNPDVLVEPDLGDIGMRDFRRLDDAIAAGRRAAEAALPRLVHLLETSSPGSTGGRRRALYLTVQRDPVCDMVVNPSHARASVTHRGEAVYFCSENCRDRFKSDPERYLGSTPKAGS